MTDTTRTRAELEALLADNSTGDITAQTLRDLLKSVPVTEEKNVVDGYAGLDADGKLLNTVYPDSFDLRARQGTASALASTVLASGEFGWATDEKYMVMGDGVTAGGVRVGPIVGGSDNNTNYNVADAIISSYGGAHLMAYYSHAQMASCIQLIVKTATTIPVKVKTTLGYCKGINSDGTSTAVCGTGTPSTLLTLGPGTPTSTLKNWATPVAPYNSILPRALIVVPCDVSGNVSGGFTSVDISSQIAVIGFGCGATVVSDGIDLHNTSLTSLNLPALITSGTISISYDHLTSLSMPALTTVNGSLSLGNNLLQSLSLPALTTVTGNIDLRTNPLTSLSLPGLTTGGILLDNTFITSLSLPVLTTGSTISINTVPLTSLNLPAFITGIISIGHTSLASLSLPSLTTSTSLTIGNNLLTSVNLSALTTVGSMYLGYNSLPSLSLPALTTVTGNVTLSHNALTNTSISSLLVLFAGTGMPSKTSLNFSGQAYSHYTPTTEASVAMASLSSSGVNVVTDPT